MNRPRSVARCMLLPEAKRRILQSISHASGVVCRFCVKQNGCMARLKHLMLRSMRRGAVVKGFLARSWIASLFLAVACRNAPPPKVGQAKVVSIPVITSSTDAAAPQQPIARVGSHDPRTPPTTTVAFAKLEDACDALTDRNRAAWDQARKEGIVPWREVGPATCAPVAVSEQLVTAGDAGSLVALTASVYTAEANAQAAEVEGELLAVRSPQGSFLTAIQIRGEQRTMFSREDYRLLDARWLKSKRGTVLTVQVAVRREITNECDSSNPECRTKDLSQTHRGIVCEVAGGTMACRTQETNVAATEEQARTFPVREHASGEVVFDVR
jgi:hypothetical protein